MINILNLDVSGLGLNGPGVAGNCSDVQWEMEKNTNHYISTLKNSLPSHKLEEKPFHVFLLEVLGQMSTSSARQDTSCVFPVMWTLWRKKNNTTTQNDVVVFLTNKKGVVFRAFFLTTQLIWSFFGGPARRMGASQMLSSEHSLAVAWGIMI